VPDRRPEWALIDPKASGRRLRWRARSRLADNHLFLAANRPIRNRAVVDRSTELVIEGFPRSANTFAAVAFQIAQPRPVRLAHHLHASSQVTWALEAGIPALVLVRDPSEAAVSLVARSPYLTLRDALRGYARFYEPLVRHRDACVVGRFGEVTTDLGAVIGELNAKAGTHFESFEHSETNVASAYALIDLRTKQPPLAGAIDSFTSGKITRESLERLERAAGSAHARVPEHRVARPSQRRREIVATLAEKLRGPELVGDLRRAQAAFAAFTTNS
jgi:hypothetical protein